MSKTSQGLKMEELENMTIVRLPANDLSVVQMRDAGTIFNATNIEEAIKALSNKEIYGWVGIVKIIGTSLYYTTLEMPGMAKSGRNVWHKYWLAIPRKIEGEFKWLEWVERKGFFFSSEWSGVTGKQGWYYQFRNKTKARGCVIM